MLAWVPLSLLSAAANAGYFYGLKRLIADHGQHLAAGGTHLSASLFLLSAALIAGVPAVGPLFLPAVAGTTALNAGALVLTLRAFRTTDLSIAVPMLSFTPAVLLLLSPVFEGVLPSPAGVAGVLLIVAGSYVLNLSPRAHSLLDPLRALGREPGVRAMLGVAVIYAFTSELDKVVVTQSDPVFGSAVVTLLLGALFLVRGATVGRGSRSGESLRPALAPVAAYGVLLAVTVVSINAAFLFVAVPYAIALKRTSGLFSVGIGCVVGGEEGLPERGAGAALMVAGAAVVVLSAA
jgi:drug/metabolite transporter (DMT)-like permease